MWGIRLILGIIYNIIKKYMFIYFFIFVIGNIFLGYKREIRIESVILFFIIFILSGVYYKIYPIVDKYLSRLKK